MRRTKGAANISLQILLMMCGIWGLAWADSIDSTLGLAGMTKVVIPLNDDQLPASDLLYDENGQTRNLSPEEAWELKKKYGIDLSKLEPDPTTDIWTPESTASDSTLDEALPVQTGDTVEFSAVIQSITGRLKFNIRTMSGTDLGHTYTVVMSEELHSILLRKELLRRLGYRIPAMKWLPRITVRFPDELTKLDFVRNVIPNQTYGQPERWRVDTPARGSPLEVTFQDVFVMEATPLYYNTALGAPIDINHRNRPKAQRILRTLAILYDIANVPESVNQVDWYAARVENNSIVFSVADQANFGCTRDDALWVLSRLVKLTRDDYEMIVAGAHYPQPVAKLLVEKLIARRNSLLSLFQTGAADIPFDSQISDGNVLVKGMIKQEDWTKEGYASRFAHGEMTSPLHDLWWYLTSQIQSNAMENLLNYANQKLPSLNGSDAINKHRSELYQDALNQFFTTGNVQAVGFGAWAAPLASGGIDISRQVVMGSYMGTNNLVQLADTFGFHASAGIYIGFDGLPAGSVPVDLSSTIKGNASISVTHLKPLKNLKSAVTEPLQNEFVPWIFYKSSQYFKKVSELQNEEKAITTAELNKLIAADYDQLKKYLGKGESLILTESLGASESINVSAQLTVPVSPSIVIQPGANQLVLWRLHIYRKDESTILVFKDKGALDGVSISFGLNVSQLGEPARFPVLNVSAKHVSGSADSKFFKLNMHPDVTRNKDLYSNAAAIVASIRGGSTETLESLQKPMLISTKFRDASGWSQFLSFVDRRLRTNGDVTIKQNTGSEDHFISVTDGNQSGGNYQSLFSQAATYFVQWLKGSSQFGINTHAAPDPGQTFMGYSTTRQAIFQARLNGGLTDEFMRIQHRWGGWDISAAKAVALTDSLSAKYGFKLFQDGYLQDTTNVQLYNVSLALNLYKPAIEKLLSLSYSEQQSLTEKYNDKYHCDEDPDRDDSAGHLRPSAPRPDFEMCAAIRDFESASVGYQPKGRGWLTTVFSLFHLSLDFAQFREFFRAWRSEHLNPAQQAQAILQYVSNLEKFLDFREFLNLTGGTDHLYLTAQISGFRVGSENLSVPILGNTLGTVDPNHPGGPLDAAQNIIGINDGEFSAQWVRDHL